MRIPASLARLALIGWIVASAAIATTGRDALVAVAVAGIAAAGICWAANRRGTGDLLALATAAWLLPAWASAGSVSSTLRALALAAAVASLPLLLHALIGRDRRLVLLDSAVAATVVAHVVWFDPFIDRRCSQLCDASPLAFAANATSEGVVRVAGTWVPIAVAAAGVLAAWRGSARLPVALAAAGLLASAIVGARAIAVEPTDDLALGGNRAALGIGAAATVAALLVAAWPGLSTLRARRAVARIARRLGEDALGVEDVRSALVAATGQDSLQVAYRHAARWIDARGERVAAPAQPTADIQVAGETIAAITGLADARALGPAMRLSLANERLRAGVLAEIADLRSSRERIVVAGDAERRLLERNLHDGAQQRMLALSFELRRARARVDGTDAGRIDGAIAEADLALAELRSIAHGIFPTLLVDAGLETALHALADATHVPVLIACSLPERPEPAAEMAAYRVAAEAIEHATASGSAGEIEIDITLADTLRVQVTHEDLEPRATDDEGFADAADRVTALGGTITVRRISPSAAVVEAVIPCAS